jgi:signal transduction histidine kinase
MYVGVQRAPASTVWSIWRMSAGVDAIVRSRAVSRRAERHQPLNLRLTSYLPRGNLLTAEEWAARHRILRWFLALHVPTLTAFGILTGNAPVDVWLGMVPIVACLALGVLVRHRRTASFFTTAGIVYCSTTLVAFSHGRIEAHFHFFVIIGFIALYQDWLPFLWNILFTVLSHGVGSAFRTDLMFNHHAAQHDPWLWSLVHGLAVLAACVGMVIYWRRCEDEQQKALTLTQELDHAAVGRFTSELLVNLARRNQSILYRQLDLINQLEEQESDPDQLGVLFRLDHLATRIRRNAESLLVLAGEEPSRVWKTPVRLVDIVRAAIAETEDLDRVSFVVDERLSVLGHAVTDLTHLLAELTENAVRFSPPGSGVTIRSNPDVRSPGTWVITIEDWGVGMPPEDLAIANEILSRPRDVDVAASQRLGLHVVSRLAYRHGVEVSLTATSTAGMTAVVVLPPGVFAQGRRQVTELAPAAVGWGPPRQEQVVPRQPEAPEQQSPPRWDWTRWWAPEPHALERPGDARRGGARLTPANGIPAKGIPANGTPADDIAVSVTPAHGLPANGVPPNGTVVTADPVADWQPAGGPLDATPGVPTPPAETVTVWVTDADGAERPAANGNGAGGDHDGAGSHPETETASPAGALQPEPGEQPTQRAAPVRIRLSQRRPQAHLAPELRRGAEDGRSQSPSVPRPDAVKARDALSRYQANRRAALAKDVTEEGPARER